MTFYISFVAVTLLFLDHSIIHRVFLLSVQNQSFVWGPPLPFRATLSFLWVKFCVLWGLLSSYKLRKQAHHKCNIPSFLKYLLGLRALWFKTHRSSVLKDVQQSPVKSHRAWRVQLAYGTFRFSSFCFDHVLLL